MIHCPQCRNLSTTLRIGNHSIRSAVWTQWVVNNQGTVKGQRSGAAWFSFEGICESLKPKEIEEAEISCMNCGISYGRCAQRLLDSVERNRELRKIHQERLHLQSTRASIQVLRT